MTHTLATTVTAEFTGYQSRDLTSLVRKVKEVLPQCTDDAACEALIANGEEIRAAVDYLLTVTKVQRERYKPKKEPKVEAPAVVSEVDPVAAEDPAVLTEPLVESSEPPRVLSENEKLQMKLRKKLRDIERIEAKLATAQKVDPLQLPKLEKKEETLRELRQVDEKVASELESRRLEEARQLAEQRAMERRIEEEERRVAEERRLEEERVKMEELAERRRQQEQAEAQRKQQLLSEANSANYSYNQPNSVNSNAGQYGWQGQQMRPADQGAGQKILNLVHQPKGDAPSAPKGDTRSEGKNRTPDQQQPRSQLLLQQSESEVRDFPIGKGLPPAVSPRKGKGDKDREPKGKDGKQDFRRREDGKGRKDDGKGYKDGGDADGKFGKGYKDGREGEGKKGGKGKYPSQSDSGAVTEDSREKGKGKKGGKKGEKGEKKGKGDDRNRTGYASREDHEVMDEDRLRW